MVIPNCPHKAAKYFVRDIVTCLAEHKAATVALLKKGSEKPGKYRVFPMTFSRKLTFHFPNGASA